MLTNLKPGGGKTSTRRFLFKRWLRLAAGLYPFLLACTVVYVLAGIDFSPKALVLNFLMLGWVDRLPGLGQLWFVTMIAACYALLALLRRRPSRFRHPAAWALLLVPGMALDALGLPGYSFLVLAYCALAFLYARPLVDWSLTVKPAWLVCGTLVVGVSVFLCIDRGMLHVGEPAYYYTTACSGIAAFVLLLRLFTHWLPGKILCAVSAVSYELYLVHHPLCLGELSLFGLCPSVHSSCVALLIYAVSGVAAWGLHRVAVCITAWAKRK